MMTDSGELTCRELVELVTDYLEGSLPVDERARFDEHLMGCGGCRTYVDQMRHVVRALGRLTADDVPEEARTSLLKAFREWKSGR
jgi:anti-sigma factor RsiW